GRQERARLGLAAWDADPRHANCEQSRRTIRRVGAGEGRARAAGNGAGHGPPLPLARPDLRARSWVAANSLDAARIAGRGGHNMMFSFLRTPEQYEALWSAYHSEGGGGSVAANRPSYGGEGDARAWAEVEPALRNLFRRFRQEGKIAADVPEPERFNAENTPGQFLVGGPETILHFVRDLQARVPFDT